MPRTSRILTRRNAALASAGVLVGVVALLAACGGKSDNGTGSTPGDGSGANALQSYVSCLSKNGVNLQLPSGRPDGGTRPSGFPSDGFPSGLPTGGFPSGGVPPSGAAGGRFGGGAGAFQKPDGVDDATWQKAQEACASVRPTGGPGGAGGPGADNGALSAYRNCLSDHGVTASAGIGQLDSTDPTVVAAEQACAALRPTAAPAPTSTG